MRTIQPRLTALALAVTAAWPVLAQQGPSTKPEEDATQRVVVTASKRLERQREVAGTVSVVDGAELERRGARDQEDTLKLTPGVQFNKGDIASNTITIRGIGTSTTNEGSGAQQSPTGQYLEDVPLAAAQGKGTVWDPITFDLDRVEVLRGPQGVLFGSGSLGGAVRYLFNKPRLGNFEAAVKGEYASATSGDSTFSLYGMVNAPLGNTAAIRAVAFDRKDPGYIDNLGTGKKDANTLNQRGGRVLATVKPINTLTATLAVSTQKTKQGDTFSVSPDPTRLEHTAPNNSQRESKSDFAALTLDYDFGPAVLTSITGYWKNKTNTLIDDTELFGSVGLVLPEVFRPSTGSEKAKSQELRVASKPGGAFSYVAGVLYQKSDGSGAAAQIDPSAAFGLTDLVALTTASGGTEKAVFADTEFKLGSNWSVGAGGRYYKTSTTFQQRGTIFGAPSPVPVSGVGTIDSSDSGFTPKLTAKYRFDDNNQWYAVVSKGYRYGGANSDPNCPEQYKSDSLWNYETGVRLSVATGLQLDLSAFVLDWKDAQFSFFTLSNGVLPTSCIDNVGKARSRGMEMALRYRANAAFDFAASIAYTSAKTLEAVAIPSGGPTSITAPSGSRLPGVSPLQFALQGNYKFAGPFDTQGRVNVTLTSVDKRVMFLGDAKPADGFETIDLGVSLARENWTFAAGLANATNEKGVLSITGAPAGQGPFAQYFLQRPRTLTASLRYDY
jgi:iron complex outermembrane recepter protein